MDVVRRYVRGFALGVVVLLFVIILVGSLVKLYEVTGLKQYLKKHRRPSETDDEKLEGGSARRLLLDSDTESREDATTKETVKSERVPLKNWRRQHSNSDSENPATTMPTIGLPRSKSDQKRVDDDARRSRTLSENGVTVTQPPHSRSPPIERDGSKVSDSSQTSVSRQSTLQGNKSMKEYMASLGTLISASSSQDGMLMKQMSEPTALSSAPQEVKPQRSAPELRDDANDDHFTDVDSEQDSSLTRQQQRRKASPVRLLMLFPVISISAFLFLTSACWEQLLDDSICLKILPLTAALAGGLRKARASTDSLVNAAQHQFAIIISENQTTAGIAISKTWVPATGALLVIALFTFIFFLACLRPRKPSGSAKTIKRTNSAASEEYTGSRPVTPISPTSTNRTPTPRNAKAILSPDYATHLVSKLEKIPFSAYKCDPNGVEIPSDVVNHNIIEQCAVFCLMITDDEFARTRCIEELRWALLHKPPSAIIVIVLDNASLERTPRDLQMMVRDAPEITVLNWPAASLKKATGVFEEETKSMCELCDIIRGEKERESQHYIWDAYISHFRCKNRETLMKAMPLSAISSTANALSTIVSAISDQDSISHATNLIQSLINARVIGIIEGSVLLNVLENKVKDDELLEKISAGSGSVVEVPVSPKRFGTSKSSAKKQFDGDSDSLKFRNASAETARKMTMAERSKD